METKASPILPSHSLHPTAALFTPQHSVPPPTGGSLHLRCPSEYNPSPHLRPTEDLSPLLLTQLTLTHPSTPGAMPPGAGPATRRSGAHLVPGAGPWASPYRCALSLGCQRTSQKAGLRRAGKSEADPFSLSMRRMLQRSTPHKCGRAALPSSRGR